MVGWPAPNRRGPSSRVDALSIAGRANLDSRSITNALKRIKRRWFVLRVVEQNSTVLLQSRSTLSWLRGPDDTQRTEDAD